MASFQQQMQTIRKEQVAQQQFAQTGGGLFSVTVNGNNEVVSIEFSDAASDDLELLADLIQVATNQAMQQTKTYSTQQMQALTAGLPIPPGMHLACWGCKYVGTSVQCVRHLRVRIWKRRYGILHRDGDLFGSLSQH